MIKKFVEVENEGLISFIGKKITVYCDSWIYSGILEGVNENCIKLSGEKGNKDNPVIVYNTGDHITNKWEAEGKMPESWYIMISKIESFGFFK